MPNSEATNPMPAVEMLPCPFCGGPGDLRVSRDGEAEWVHCPNCCVSGAVKLTATEAITAWNTRASLPHQGEVERLREALAWYADPSNWWTPNSNGPGHHQMGNGSIEISMGKPGVITDGKGALMAGQFLPDAGNRAREALSESHPHAS